MRKIHKIVAITVMFSFVSAAGSAWAAPLQNAGSQNPAVTGENPALARALTGVPAVNLRLKTPTDREAATSPKTIRGTIQAMNPALLLPLPVRHATPLAAAYSQAQQPTGGTGFHLGKGTKTAIWLTAVTVATVWGYKTFSVTRGTD